ncbi:unnamed protein product [Anisakis simplex]|uniref:TLDc domain-containing protein n=1 Tax=Anisakis simplex TaxID=6269 RepID=A0A0M3K2K8_ANISI|nr:unnamed protein product [Anisakis simplex]
MDVELFAQKILSLIDGTSDCYIEVLSTADQIIRLCANNAGIFDLDAQFMDIITEDMVKRGTSCESLIAWKNENCARMCSALQMHVLRQLNLITHLWNFRFETNVFDYRGPTVSIFHLQDGQIFVLAVDQEWRHSGSKFGSVDSVLIELQPKFKRIQKGSSVYCNLKLRNYPMKLSFDANEMSIDKEMSEVIAVEVFGCSSEKTLQEQHKQKDWQRKQVEKNKKVPLPGRWDDNPDKFILELGGVYSTADRREVFRRDD